MSANDAPAGLPSRQPRGFALAAAMFALVIIAALVTGGFFAARQEMRIGLNSRTSLRAFSAAEAGVNTSIANWQTGTWNNLAINDSVTITGSLGSGTGAATYGGSIRRLNTELFLVRSVGTDQASSAQRTIAALVRLQLIQMNFNAALTVRGNLKVLGSSLINGRDQVPTGWSACPSTGLDTLPGVTLPTLVGSNISLSNVSGDPKILVDPTINDSTFFKFGDLDWNELVAMATVTLAGGNLKPVPSGTATTCTTSNTLNWGEPLKPPTVAGCSTYFPIIHVTGDLQMSQGRGQGILLVDGDIKATGQFEFYGPVIARGSLSTQGNGNHFWGGVMSANADFDLSTVTGNAEVSYSSCALTTALRASSPGRLVRERSWAEVF